MNKNVEMRINSRLDNRGGFEYSNHTENNKGGGEQWLN